MDVEEVNVEKNNEEANEPIHDDVNGEANDLVHDDANDLINDDLHEKVNYLIHDEVHTNVNEENEVDSNYETRNEKGEDEDIDDCGFGNDWCGLDHNASQ